MLVTSLTYSVKTKYDYYTICQMKINSILSLIVFLTLYLISLVIPSQPVQAQIPVNMTCSANISIVQPGGTFDLTVSFSDGNPHSFQLEFSEIADGPVINPTINPYTITIIAPSAPFQSVRARALEGDHSGCTINVTNTTEPTSNDCVFRTSPNDLMDLDNPDGNLHIIVTVASGPTAHYKVTIKNNDNEIVEEENSLDSPPFTINIAAPDIIGVYKLDVTGVRQDNGEDIDCNTNDGLLFKILNIRSGDTPGSGFEGGDETGELDSRVKNLVNNILSFAIGIAGGVAFLLLIYGGFKFMFSFGNPENIQQGREIITSAIIGLLVVVFSVFLLRLIGISILGLPI